MKYKILFVCMGNICRSPAAEGVMQALVTASGLQDQIEIDSAGTGGWHAGELPDARMRRHGSLRGYRLQNHARQVVPQDFENFDLILVMDQQNMRDLREFAVSANDMQNVRYFCDYLSDRPETEVPDPYYGGADGFDEVLDIVENGCKGLLTRIIAERPLLPEKK